MKTSIDEEVASVRASHPTWTFEQCWSHIMGEQPWRAARSAEMIRLEAKQAPQKEQEDREEFARVEGIAKRLMQRNPKMLFGEALSIVRLCSPKPGPVNAAFQPEPKPKLMLVRGSVGTYVD